MTDNITPEAVDPRCATCGHKRSEHHYRHPFVGPSQPDTIAALSARLANVRRQLHDETVALGCMKARAEAAEAKLAAALVGLDDLSMEAYGYDHLYETIFHRDVHEKLHDIILELKK